MNVMGRKGEGRCRAGVGVSQGHYGQGDESSTTLKFHVTCLTA